MPVTAGRTWRHGEARNGGTPDWILKKKYLADRSADPVYKTYVEKYYAQIGKQLQGLMFKDNGPVIGIQLENEYWKGKAGEPYILWLKQTAQKYGMSEVVWSPKGKRNWDDFKRRMNTQFKRYVLWDANFNPADVDFP